MLKNDRSKWEKRQAAERSRQMDIMEAMGEDERKCDPKAKERFARKPYTYPKVDMSLWRER